MINSLNWSGDTKPFFQSPILKGSSMGIGSSVTRRQLSPAFDGQPQVNNRPSTIDSIKGDIHQLLMGSHPTDKANQNWVFDRLNEKLALVAQYDRHLLNEAVDSLIQNIKLVLDQPRPGASLDKKALLKGLMAIGFHLPHTPVQGQTKPVADVIASFIGLVPSLPSYRTSASGSLKKYALEIIENKLNANPLHGPLAFNRPFHGAVAAAELSKIGIAIDQAIDKLPKKNSSAERLQGLKDRLHLSPLEAPCRRLPGARSTGISTAVGAGAKVKSVPTGARRLLNDMGTDLSRSKKDLVQGLRSIKSGAARTGNQAADSINRAVDGVGHVAGAMASDLTPLVEAAGHAAEAVGHLGAEVLKGAGEVATHVGPLIVEGAGQVAVGLVEGLLNGL